MSPNAPKPGPDTIIPERAPVLGVALRYFLLGLFFLAVLLVVAFWKAPMLAGDYLHNPATLAVTHLFTLGFAGSVVTGAVYQLTPVLLYSKIKNETLANTHLVMHAIGVALMVVGFLNFMPVTVSIGGSLVIAGVCLFIGNLVVAWKNVERWNWHGYFMVAAVTFYLATIIWGLVLALNLHYGFLGDVQTGPLEGHLTLGLLGFFGLMIVGVAMKLVPMFAPGKPLPVKFVMGVGSANVLGVLLILGSLWAGDWLRWTGIVAVMASYFAFAGAMVYTWRMRRPGPLDWSIRFAVTAAVLLLIPVIGFFPAGRMMRAGLVFFFAMAWVGGTILGLLLRIIPFMVWLHRFRNRLQKVEKIPFLHEMFQPKVGWVPYLTWFPGVLLMALGMALRSGAVIRAGVIVILPGMVGYGLILRQVLYHVPPGRAALFPGKKG